MEKLLDRNQSGDAGGHELNMRQHCALVAKVANSLQSCVRKSIATRSWDMIMSPLFHAARILSGVLDLALFSVVEERHGGNPVQCNDD